MNKSSIIELRSVTVDFDGEIVLDRLNLSIGDGEFVTLLGASGCGKTTTLRVIGGFIKPSSGEVFFDGAEVSEIPPNKGSRKMARTLSAAMMAPEMVSFI